MFLVIFGCSTLLNTKANHNYGAWSIRRCCGVSDSSKLQIQKQITTRWGGHIVSGGVFPIVQSYKFKSKSQPMTLQGVDLFGCFR